MPARFDPPVSISLGDGRMAVVRTPEQAERLLGSVDWPQRGPRHRDATETCAKAVGGARSTADARTSFVDAAREAGVLKEASDG